MVCNAPLPNEQSRCLIRSPGTSGCADAAVTSVLAHRLSLVPALACSIVLLHRGEARGVGLERMIS